MVIGGQAVLLYGEPRLTRDIDITLGVDAGAFEAALSAGEAAGLLPAVEDPLAVVESTNVLLLRDTASGVRVDLIFSFTPYEALAIRRATPVMLHEVPVRFAAAEDLVIHKLVAGRPRDIEDIQGIVRRTPALDEHYLREWLPQFREATGRDLLKEYESLRARH
jgi:hypothetical protein